MNEILCILSNVKDIAKEWVEYTEKERCNLFKTETAESRAVGAMHAIYAILKQIDDEQEENVEA